MTNEDLFSLYEIGAIAVIINSITIIPSTRHELTPPTNHAIIKREIIILTINFLNMPLNNRNPPATRKSIMRKHHQHVLVPKIFPLRIFLLDYFLIS